MVHYKAHFEHEGVQFVVVGACLYKCFSIRNAVGYFYLFVSFR